MLTFQHSLLNVVYAGGGECGGKDDDLLILNATCDPCSPS